MLATTIFKDGKWYAAIRWYQRLWVVDSGVHWETEDGALEAAEGAVSYCNGNATEYINKLGYSPQAIEPQEAEQVKV